MAGVLLSVQSSRDSVSSLLRVQNENNLIEVAFRGYYHSDRHLNDNVPPLPQVT